ncbi:TPA: DUF4868 domain-containing protein [Stenotrophomonas maltophilia]|uniref:Kiwa anti-phage protein KwaB-like domain-containing protein n=1 Tax=Stenotrophomonas TaxID=40323 RepID=UPI0009789D05|nr:MULTISPECIES: Kiwa anti-phage protein KwaB-like domain-containing protein [Stenotrophomonas]MCV4214512.1 DUF4868 domain-containing protein [Pseudomonas cichorii]MBH1465612.1 DUF4868 domain-containing protein [Stenotrophomonas maltophilia]MBH1612213.1 DUF4868 domain-containing protein [Stenotrophomonas maltophilia]MBN5083931.1 DUF4868 domain-containing protein [Stenotrophomonas maltophilia]MBN5167917.1 DUF4868 domain-containing protein [Stenotrophomonas maltophilia]
MSDLALKSLKAFDLAGSNVFLWVFKRSAGTKKFKAFYIKTDPVLEDALKGFAENERARINEWIPYGHLSQPTDDGCLTIAVGDTDFQVLKDLVDEPESDHATNDLKKLKGAVGYLVKFVKDGKTLYATRRTPMTWKPVYKKKNVINAIFENGQLSAVAGDEFTLEPRFDIFALDDVLLVSNKRGFESMMQYRAGYVQAFGELKAEPSFSALFTDMAPLLEYVGENGTHLKRMAVIQEKSLYSDPKYLKALKAVATKRKWGVTFDKAGRIIPTAATAKVIITLLLDHRLVSEITDIMYDVPDGTPVK